jgi:hypothetical protein
VIDVAAIQTLLLTLASWLELWERDALAYLLEENRVLRQQVGGRRLRLIDRSPLIGRSSPTVTSTPTSGRDVGTPETLLGWRRQVPAKSTYAKQGTSSRVCSRKEPLLDPRQIAAELGVSVFAGRRGRTRPAGRRRQ